MIKLIYCLRRRAGIDRAAFQHYWLTTHAPLVAAAAETLAVARYVQCHTLDSELEAALAGSRGCTVAAYDGVAELWWESEAALAAALATPEGQRAGAVLLEDERQFIDFAGSAIFLTREDVILAR